MPEWKQGSEFKRKPPESNEINVSVLRTRFDRDKYNSQPP